MRRDATAVTQSVVDDSQISRRRLLRGIFETPSWRRWTCRNGERHLISSADQVTTNEHGANSHSLLQHLHTAQRFLSHPRKKQCQHDAECKDEKRLKRIHDKNQRDRRLERRIKRDAFADAEQCPAQRDKADDGDFLLFEEAEEISAVTGDADQKGQTGHHLADETPEKR